MPAPRSNNIPRLIFSGGFVLPVTALWIAFSCSRWFGLTGIAGVPDITIERACFVLLLGHAASRLSAMRGAAGGVTATEIGLWVFGIGSILSGVAHGAFKGENAPDSLNVLSFSILFPAVVLSIILRTRITARDLIRFCGILVVFAIYLGVTAILERTPLVWALIPPWISDPDMGIHLDRSRGPFLNAAFNGTVMVQLLPVTLLLYQLGGRLAKTVALGTVGLICVGTYLTDTRSCLLALAVVLIAGSFLSGPTRRIYMVVAGIAVLAVFLRYTVGAPIVPRLDEESPIETRLNLLLATGEMIAAHPLLGSGFGTFAQVNVDYFNRASVFGNLKYQKDWYQIGSHNTFLTPLAEVGVLLGVLYIALILRAFVLDRGAVGHTHDQREMHRGIVVCAFLVGVTFVVNAMAVEFRFILTVNALLWVFVALAERHRAQLKQARIVSPAPSVPVESHTASEWPAVRS